MLCFFKLVVLLCFFPCALCRLDVNINSRALSVVQLFFSVIDLNIFFVSFWSLGRGKGRANFVPGPPPIASYAADLCSTLPLTQS